MIITNAHVQYRCLCVHVGLGLSKSDTVGPCSDRPPVIFISILMHVATPIIIYLLVGNSAKKFETMFPYFGGYKQKV